MSLLARRPAFRTLIVASTISLVGDFLSFVALAAISLGTPSGFVGLAWVLAAHSLPKVALAPLAGLVADRFDKRSVMLAANVAQGLLTLAMAYAAYASDAPLLRTLVFVRSAASAFHTAAEAASVPRLLTGEELVVGNALMSASWGASLVFGMALGGFVAMLGPTLAMLVDASTFVVASLLLTALPALAQAEHERADAHVVRATRDALRIAFAAPHLARAFLAKSSVALAAGAAFVLLHAVVLERFAITEMPMMLGLLQALRGAGTLAGPLATSALVRRGFPEARALVGADVLVTVGLGALLLPSLTALGAASLVLGVGQGANWVISTVVIQRDAHAAYQGRLAALDELAWTTVYVSAAVAAGAMLDAGTDHVTIALVFGAIGLVLSALLARIAPSLEADGSAPSR